MVEMFSTSGETSSEASFIIQQVVEDKDLNVLFLKTVMLFLFSQFSHCGLTPTKHKCFKVGTTKFSL